MKSSELAECWSRKRTILTILRRSPITATTFTTSPGLRARATKSERACFRSEVVGASGVLVEEENNPDNTKTVTYHGDDIHDFAWTASPRYKVRESVYQIGSRRS